MSIYRWESGKSFPNESYDSLMRALKEVKGMYLFLFKKHIDREFITSKNNASSLVSDKHDLLSIFPVLKNSSKESSDDLLENNKVFNYIS